MYFRFCFWLYKFQWIFACCKFLRPLFDYTKYCMFLNNDDGDENNNNNNNDNNNNNKDILI